jgi:bifunctional DNA-binding transcriptional regulator/antitoxin component of YhaV-PrlF toxin-antitoxin module
MTGRSRTVRITAQGQVAIPVEIREERGLLPKSEVEFEGVGQSLRMQKVRFEIDEWSAEGRVAAARQDLRIDAGELEPGSTAAPQISIHGKSRGVERIRSSRTASSRATSSPSGACSRRAGGFASAATRPSTSPCRSPCRSTSWERTCPRSTRTGP